MDSDTQSRVDCPLGFDRYDQVLEAAPDADAADVRVAYREKVKQVHSDQGGSQRRLQRVNHAREVLLSE
jgi:curved DNA-binding protein CbpA